MECVIPTVRLQSDSTRMFRSLIPVCCSGAKTLKASILVFLALMSLSPVLKTLTAATSSDSIWALSACLFILNALLADYTAMNPRSHKRER